MTTTTHSTMSSLPLPGFGACVLSRHDGLDSKSALIVSDVLIVDEMQEHTYLNMLQCSNDGPAWPGLQLDKHRSKLSVIDGKDSLESALIAIRDQ